MSGLASIHVLRIESNAIPLEVLINGLPVIYLDGNHSSPVVLQEPNFLRSGRNTLEVIVNAGPVASQAERPWRTPSTALTDAPPARVFVRLDVRPIAEANIPPAGEASVAFEWQGTAYGDPSTHRRDFTVMGSYPAPWWQRADQIDMSKDAKSAAAYVDRLRSMLLANDIDGFLRSQRTRFVDAARAIQGDPGAIEQFVRNALEEVSQPPYALAPLAPTGLDFRLLCDRRVLQVTTGTRTPPIHFIRPDDQDDFGYTLLMAQMGGDWTPIG